LELLLSSLALALESGFGAFARCFLRATTATPSANEVVRALEPRASEGVAALATGASSPTMSLDLRFLPELRNKVVAAQS